MSEPVRFALDIERAPFHRAIVTLKPDGTVWIDPDADIEQLRYALREVVLAYHRLDVTKRAGSAQ